MTAIKAYLRQEREVLPLLLFRIVLGVLFFGRAYAFGPRVGSKTSIYRLIITFVFGAGTGCLWLLRSSAISYTA